MRESLPHSRRESSAPPSHRPGQLRSELLTALSLALPYHQNVNTKAATGAARASTPRPVPGAWASLGAPPWRRRSRHGSLRGAPGLGGGVGGALLHSTCC